MRIERVSWTDHCGTEEWSTADEVADLQEMEIVGFVIKETKKTLYIASMYYPAGSDPKDATFGHSMAIAKKLITRRETLVD